MTSNLKRTPLYQEHLDREGRMTAFSGWEMPLQYAGIVAEHRAVRARAGVFDVSHLGRLQVQGPEAQALLQKLTTSDLSSLAPGRVRYTFVCREDGGILDDILVYRLGLEEYLVTTNAINRDKLLAWFRQWQGELRVDSASSPQVEVRDWTEELAMLAFQGPLAGRHLEALGSPPQGLGRQGCLRTQVAGFDSMVARTGFTGEDGFEIMLEPLPAVSLWRRFLGHGVAPCGLGARDTLRLEAGFILYGNEVDETVNPYELGMGHLVHLGKGSFLGRERLKALSQETPRRRLVGLEVVGRGVARPSHALYMEARAVGQVTSGTYAPTLERNIALAFVSPEVAAPGTSLEVDIRGHRVEALVRPLPFYRRQNT